MAKVELADTSRHFRFRPEAPPTHARLRRIDFYVIRVLSQLNISFRRYWEKEVLWGRRVRDVQETWWRTCDIQDVDSPIVGQEMGSSLRKRKVTVPDTNRLAATPLVWTLV